MHAIERRAATERLRRCVVPTSQYPEIYEAIYSTILSGLVGRNPVDPRFVRWHSDLARNAVIREATSSPTLLLTGLSGSGKSTLVESVLSCFPQVIRHTRYSGEPLQRSQLVYLRVDVPPDASRRAFCLSILDAIDSALDTNYGTQYRKPHTRLGDLETAICTACTAYGVGILVLDELQNINVQNAGGQEALLNLFDTLTNRARVPIMQVGTPAALRVFGNRFRAARRAGTAGVVELERPVHGSEDWQFLVEVAWRGQWVKNPTPLTKSLDKTLYTLSQGLPAVLYRLVALANHAAISEGSERINAQCLKAVYRKQFGLMRPALSALRKGDQGRYEDLMSVGEWFDTGGSRGSLHQIFSRANAAKLGAAEITELRRRIEDAFLEANLNTQQKGRLRKLWRSLGLTGEPGLSDAQ
ncbi:AAA family ATPase [Ectothiorhodospiraceae bacterium WFHF3C12]|nr:AAA family ATPase [Ectothiorhodospiraceae bacterium WFHF3C12]